jgi:hypothetical protein
MDEPANALPDDVDALKTMVIAARLRNAQLEHLIALLQRMQLGSIQRKQLQTDSHWRWRTAQSATPKPTLWLPRARMPLHRKPEGGAIPAHRVLRCLRIFRAWRWRSCPR